MALTIAASFIAVGCGDNTDFGDPSIGDQSDAPTIADDRFEDIDVIVADACSGLAAADNSRSNSLDLSSELDDGNADVNSLELTRDPNIDGGGAVPSNRGDVLDPAAVPVFCGSARAPVSSDDTGVLGAANNVCSCEYPSCVAEAIADSFGCDVCVTFGCGDFDVSDCVACQ